MKTDDIITTIAACMTPAGIDNIKSFAEGDTVFKQILTYASDNSQANILIVVPSYGMIIGVADKFRDIPIFGVYPTTFKPGAGIINYCSPSFGLFFNVSILVVIGDNSSVLWQKIAGRKFDIAFMYKDNNNNIYYTGALPTLYDDIRNEIKAAAAQFFQEKLAKETIMVTPLNNSQLILELREYISQKYGYVIASGIAITANEVFAYTQSAFTLSFSDYFDSLIDGFLLSKYNPNFTYQSIKKFEYPNVSGLLSQELISLESLQKAAYQKAFDMQPVGIQPNKIFTMGSPDPKSYYRDETGEVHKIDNKLEFAAMELESYTFEERYI